jgi:class 3 adenylate cyclase/tetratricopeptide (TPR) repeat protein
MQRRERKVVTVLFADLVGFTARAEQLDPEDVEAMLRPYHERLRTELERYGGTVEKFIGDAVMAVFGAPVAHEDDAERAVRAALAIKDWATDDGDLDVRIAINGGEALVALDARPEAGEAMVSGDVVNTAARLQAAAPVNGILVGEQTYRATRHVVDYKERAPVEAKGKAAAVPVWEAVDARSRFGIDVVQAGRAPLVGRAREIALLTDALERARNERRPELVTLIGVPGIGKSRLVFELMQAAQKDPDLITWRQGRCVPYGDGVTFWAIGEIVKAHAGIFESDSAERAQEKLERAVATAIADPVQRAWIGSNLRPLVGVASEAERLGDAEAEAFGAWTQFFESLAEETPLVLVIEDLHWADDKLLEFVDHLVDRAADVGILVVATARPELLDRRSDWGGGKPNALTLSLSPLSDDDTARLLASLLERAVLPADAQQAVLARAGGNPLFAEQYARMFAEREGVEEVPVPETVHGIIAARLDGLSPAEKSLLQDASVHGKVFWAGALAAMRAEPIPVVDGMLYALERREFVRRQRRSSVAGEREYAFRHFLVRDVAYGQIPRADRAEKHRLAADWIDALAENRDDHVELLADHCLNALEFARAAGKDTSDLEVRARRALRDAGSRAAALNAFAAAARLFEDAVALWPSDDPERPSLLLRYGRALRFAREAGDEQLREAATSARAAGDLETSAEAEVLLSDLAWHRGRLDESERHLEEAQTLVERSPSSPAKARVLASVARRSVLGDEYARALQIGREALTLAQELGLDELRAFALEIVGSSRMFSGDRGGLRDVEQGLDLALSLNSPEAIRIYNNLAVDAVSHGELRRAEGLVDEGLRYAERFGEHPMARFMRGSLPGRYYNSGEWDLALRLADEFIGEIEAGSPHTLEPYVRRVRSWVFLGRGELAHAAAESEKALAIGRAANDPTGLPPLLATHALVLHASGRIDEARPLLEELAKVMREARTTATPMGADVAGVITDVGLGTEFSAVMEKDEDTIPWRRAARLIFAGRPEEAASIYADMGVAAAEAYANLRAAAKFVAEDRRAEADEHLRRALAFYRSVGAKRYVAEGEALLAASA